MINWAEEGRHWLHIFRWYLMSGVIMAPFGVLYGIFVGWRHHQSTPAFIMCIIAGLFLTYKIQGLPPD